MFRFLLDPLETVEPWGSAETQRTVHWWALTAGVFSIELGGAHLYELHPTQLTELDERTWLPEAWRGAFDDYLAAIWRALSETLPAALEPVPRDLVPELEAIIARSLRCRAEPEDDAPEPAPEESRRISALESQAYDWVWDREFSPGCCPSATWCWRVEDRVHWRWAHHFEGGAPLWAAGDGHHELALSDFLFELGRFEREFARVMAQRIDQAERHRWPPGVVFDADEVRHQHVLEMAAFQQAFDVRNRRPADWSFVREALAALATR